jgi:pimeloyl-ACP methyl ester carboxylesterase
MSTITVKANGLEFEVEEWGSGDRLALCLHGFPEHAHSWRLQGPMLADLGYRVWAPNQRGYGKTSRPRDMMAYSLKHLLADVAALIDASGAKSVTLIAHDWGAIVAWWFAIRNARPLEKLVIMNVPHPVLFRDVAKNLPAQRKKSWYVRFFQFPWLPEFMLGRNRAARIARMIRGSAVDKSRFPRDVLDVYRENAAQPGALTAMINWYRANFRGGGIREQMKLGIPVIDVPTLMVWGEEDVALCKETTYGTERYVRDLTLRYLPGVSHWVQQEAPETVNAMLAAFLRGERVPEAAELQRTVAPSGSERP